MSPTRLDRVQTLALGSIGVSIAALALKSLAYVQTGSVALYSDAIETTINVVTAVAAFAAVRISALPADANHPYGHAKAEYMSAVVEGVLIILASIAILRESYLGFRHPPVLTAPALGLLLNGVATGLNGVWSWVLMRQGRRARSPALVANGRHLVSDLYASAGVFLGVGLVALTGWRLLDPLIAALVAASVLWSGWGVVTESLNGLMDAALPDEDLARVQAIISANLGDAIQAHDLRTRRAGRLTFIDFHLIVSGSITVLESHAICDRLEGGLKAAFPESLISIHVEPEDKVKDGGMTLPEHPEPPGVQA